MGLDTVIAKTVFAFVFSLILIWVIRPGLGVFGTITCPNCSTFINAFIFIVIPIAVIFIGVYQVMSVFTRRIP